MSLNEIYNEAGLTAVEIKQIGAWLLADCEPEENFYDSTAYEKLFEYFAFEACEMPYGVAKARTGCPDEWIIERLERCV